MTNTRIVQACVVLAFWLGALLSTVAGDSLYGKVTQVRTADTVILDYGKGQYVVRIIGIDVPKEGPLAIQAREFVSKMVLDKNARIRTRPCRPVAQPACARKQSFFRQIFLVTEPYRGKRARYSSATRIS